MKRPINPFDPDQEVGNPTDKLDQASVTGQAELSWTGEEAPMGMSGGALEPGEESPGFPDRTGTGGTMGGGLQGTQAGGTTQVDRMNPGPGGTGREESSPNGGEIPQSGMGGSRPDMGLPGEPPQAGPAGNEEARAYEQATGRDVLPEVQSTGSTGIARQDASQSGNQAIEDELQDEGITRRMGTGGGRDGIGLPRDHVADGPQEVRETEGEP